VLWIARPEARKELKPLITHPHIWFSSASRRDASAREIPGFIWSRRREVRDQRSEIRDQKSEVSHVLCSSTIEGERMQRVQTMVGPDLRTL
jgi:hypothetical protein